MKLILNLHTRSDGRLFNLEPTTKVLKILLSKVVFVDIAVRTDLFEDFLQSFKNCFPFAEINLD